MIYLVYYSLSLLILTVFEVNLSLKLKFEAKNILYHFEKYIYNFYKEILLNKDKVYNFEKILDVIFMKRNEFIFWSHYHLEDIFHAIEWISEEKKYFYSLLDKNYSSEKEIINIKNMIDSTYKLIYIDDFLRLLLTIMTLWVYKLFVSDKKYC